MAEIKNKALKILMMQSNKFMAEVGRQHVKSIVDQQDVMKLNKLQKKMEPFMEELRKQEPDPAIVYQEDARILREALARIHNQFPIPLLRTYVNNQLRRYAKAVGEYCLHPEKADVDQSTLACLDCGERFQK